MVLLGKPEVLSREMVRPSTPTPDSHRLHRLSFFDQLSPPFYVPLLYFYCLNHQPGHDDIARLVLVDERTCVLKRSLSEALSTYYPLAAGRMRDVDDNSLLTFRCNDEGVVFVTARMNSEMSAVLSHPDGDQRDEALKLLFPDNLCYKSTKLSSPLVVQVTSFQCGGMALGICASHKILDMASFSAFVNYWAATASNSSSPIAKTHLELNLATLFPPVDLPPPLTTTTATTTIDPLPKVKSLCKRFVFGPSDIAKLKALAVVENPTRVEVVLALLVSRAISASRATSSKSTFKLTQAVNLRRRLSTTIAGHDLSLGNLSSAFATRVPEEAESDLQAFVDIIRRAKTEYFSSCAAESARGLDEFRSFIEETRKELKGEEKVYISSSWCGFPLYEADFGWGKPAWVTRGVQEPQDVIVLLDARDKDGIEAFVCLEERAMVAFQRDQTLLDFARLNPIVHVETM